MTCGDIWLSVVTHYGLWGFSLHMARGEVSSEESTEVESSAAPSHDESDNDDSSDEDSGARSGQRGVEEEPNAYEAQRQQRIRRNLAVFSELGVAKLASQMTTEERRIAKGKCVCGPLCPPSYSLYLFKIALECPQY